MKTDTILIPAVFLLLHFFLGVLPFPAHFDGEYDEATELLRSPIEIHELVKSFSSLTYQITSLQDGMKEEHQMDLLYQGTEEIDGAEVYSLAFVGSNNNEEFPLHFWFEDSDLLFFEIGGEEIPGDMAQLITAEIFELLPILPFYYLQQIGFTRVEQLEDLPIQEMRKSQGAIGELEGEMIEIQLEDMEIQIEGRRENCSGLLRLFQHEDLLMITDVEITYNGDGFFIELLSFEEQ